ncbi:MAG: hypothetical protein ACQ5SW_07470, partial [Sphaerochaetaceae bacterium]
GFLQDWVLYSHLIFERRGNHLFLPLEIVLQKKNKVTVIPKVSFTTLFTIFKRKGKPAVSWFPLL